MTVTPRVMVVDDHVTLRRGLELLLARCGCDVLPGADRAADARAKVLAERPDVLIVDMRLGGESGVELARRVLERAPEVAVLLFTGIVDPALLRAGLDSGAHGLLLKSARPEKLMAAVLALMDGHSYVDPLARDIIESAGAPERLSARERDVLGLIARGRRGDEVAAELFLSPETVRTHVRNARRKLGALTRTQAVVTALQTREIDV